MDGAHPEIKPTGGVANKGVLHIDRPRLKLEKEPIPENVKKTKVVNFTHNSSPVEPKEADVKLLRQRKSCIKCSRHPVQPTEVITHDQVKLSPIESNIASGLEIAPVASQCHTMVDLAQLSNNREQTMAMKVKVKS